MAAKNKVLLLDPPATEAEIERASQVWTEAQDVMVARGFGRLLWGNQHLSGHEFMVLVLRAADVRRAELNAFNRVTIAEQNAELGALRAETAGLKAQVAAFKQSNEELANALRSNNEAGQLGTGYNR